ncbi:spore coat protein CotF [Bacillus ectoiniformans]|nr:spore coat protein [Bacillus ectoiniformans]MBM7647736.1 spore coat protein CotF [Bacillus ectoiniformans]
MFQEKEMVNDYLSSLNASLSGYGSIISQTDNEQLRQALIQMRNADEARQKRLYDFASQQGYYQPAAAAQMQEIQQVKASLQQIPAQQQILSQQPPRMNGINPVN